MTIEIFEKVLLDELNYFVDMVTLQKNILYPDRHFISVNVSIDTMNDKKYKYRNYLSSNLRSKNVENSRG